MTMEEIRRIMDEGRAVVCGDRTRCICRDLFGGLVVVSRVMDDVPVRMATDKDLEDVRL